MTQSTKTALLNDTELDIHQIMQLLIKQDVRIVKLEKKMALLLEQQMWTQEKCTNNKNKEQEEIEEQEENEEIEDGEETDEALFNKKRMPRHIIFEDNDNELDEDEAKCMLAIDILNEQENIGSISDGEEEEEEDDEHKKEKEGKEGKEGKECKNKIDVFDNTRMKFSNELCGNN